ncbi:inositol phosphate phosphatase SopB [Endozoicomonas sp. SCSIO W0465]|uniref:inositol phosphate phosphatase SopB n=1 Tax=Endozoicomonas sp. SCSIO W0465 TaxID=2918516 RepID=UPI002075C66A|nr:inositol phosphate phosphatase SopB [Endozoicomonas sp. SCSIO W0465]USE37090.1 hypothetical protein MJO57_02340 [Endozoicomonas sp. SCSIO W0465]
MALAESLFLDDAMNLMKALGHALQTGTASSYEQVGSIPSKSVSGNPFKRWLLRLRGKEQQQEAIYSVRSVRKNLIQNYGEPVGNQVMVQGDQRPLTVRKIVKLHGKAIRQLGKIEARNRLNSKEWGNMANPESMAAKLFTCAYACSSTMLPDYEKNRLSQHIEQSFYHHGDHKLSREEAQALILDVFRNHTPGFAEMTPETGRVLQQELQQVSGNTQLYPDSFSQWQDQQPFSVMTRNQFHNFRVYSSQSARLQWQSPFDALDKQGWAEQIAATESHIDKLQATARHLLQNQEIPELLQQALVQDLHGQVVKAKSHVQYLQTLQACDFRSPDNMFSARRHNLTTALQVAEAALADKDFPEKKRTEMAVLRAQLVQEIHDLQNDPKEQIVFMQQAIRAHANELRDRLVQAGLSSRRMDQRWQTVSLNISNTKEWRTIEKTLPVRTDNGVLLYQGKITPAAQMRLNVPGQPEGERDPFAVSYHGTGCSSATRTEAKHAVNLAETRLTTDDGRVLYDGLRSGTLTPPTGTPNIDNITETRAKELLQAAVVKKLKQLPADQQQRILSGAETITFDMVSCSMLSPDRVRHITGFHDDEYNMQALQVQTLARLCSEPLPLSLMDSTGQPHNVTANIRLTTVNVPVNKLGFDPLLATGGRIWQTSDSENNKGFQALFGNIHPDAAMGGMVGEWLTGPGADSADRDKVIGLVQQIRTMYARNEHHSEGMDAYKLAERVQLLAFMIGAVPHMNCKSGKDRTGEADARTRQLASEVDRLGYVPAYNAALTRDHREAVQTFAMGAGNLEVQMQNINVPGYKTATGKDEMGNTLFGLLH